ncbi:hypothetical protein Syun_012995 [Stephania yunnanensis]|uniref:Uncharacterized protein n=1 Tax=Stephania yunnanensis TaxID=152371 RepID=A0AAP0K2S1_9MAGN
MSQFLASKMTCSFIVLYIFLNCGNNLLIKTKNIYILSSDGTRKRLLMKMQDISGIMVDIDASHKLKNN